MTKLTEILLSDWLADGDLSTVETLSEACDALDAVATDLVLLDLNLPDSSGVDTVRRIHAAAPTTPIVVLTSTSDETVGLDAIKAGAEDYLVKDETYRKLLKRSIQYSIERKCHENDLLKQQDNFRLVLDNALVGIITINGEGVIQTVNHTAEKIFGYSLEELVGHNVKVLMPEPYQSRHNGFIKRYLETGEAKIIGSGREATALRKDGTVFPAQIAVSELRMGDKNSVFTGIIRDITHEKKVKGQLVVALEEARAANSAKGEFLASMSHELRTPLNAIIGFSGSIREQIFGPLGHDKYDEYINDIQRSGEHLLELINDILDVSVIEAGKLELHEGSVSICDVVEASVRLVRHRAVRNGVTLDIAECKNMPTLFCDERRMKQILLNLFSNAVKFTPSGGTVSLQAGIDEQGRMTLTVSDTGIGMNDDQIKKAVQPFGQIDSTLSRKYEGTGLGLPLTKGLMDIHGGTMEINSKLDVGTAVTVKFPPERVVGDD